MLRTYPFLPDHTRLPEAQIPTGQEVIRTIAISRIMLDNIPHLKAYRMNIGDHLASIGIFLALMTLTGQSSRRRSCTLQGRLRPRIQGWRV